MNKEHESIKRYRAKLFASAVEKGLEPRDAVIGSWICVAIHIADEVVFGPQDLSMVNMCRLKHKDDFRAAYLSPEEGEEEAFSVYIPGLYKALKEDRKTQKLFSEEGEILREDFQRVGLECLTFLIAIHEIRHKMQYRFPEMRRFSKESKTEDKLLGKIILWQGFYMESLAKIMERDGADPEFIAKRTTGNEFDAQVVERYATHQAIKSREDLLRIIWLQPSE